MAGGVQAGFLYEIKEFFLTGNKSTEGKKIMVCECIAFS
jgi:hypothetical protein